MTVRLLADASPGEVLVALADGEVLLEFAPARPGAPDGVGDLHRARITAKVASLAGSFAALEGQADGFLPDSEGGRALHEGDVFFARVTRAAQAGKGPRLTARLSAAEREGLPPGPVALLRRGPDALLRMAASVPAAPVITNAAALAGRLRPVLGDRVVLRPGPVFGETLAAAIAALAQPEVDLPGGMRMSVTPTPALVAIDLDTGAATAARAGKRRHQLQANTAALPELARQIRLRNLSGAILVDFAGLPSRVRPQLAPALAAALAEDPLAPRLLGFTALGLAEIVRPRIHPPLHELLAGPHAAGLAALRRLAGEIAARPGVAPALRAAPAVVTALRADRQALAELAALAGRPLALHEDHALAPLGWRVVENAHV